MSTYKKEGYEVQFVKIEEIIKVKYSVDVRLKIRSTHRGPLISDIHPYSFLYSKEDLKDIKDYMHEGFETVMEGVDNLAKELTEREKS